MTIRKNPFGVGYSGDTVQVWRKLCPCCHFEFPWEAPSSEAHRVPTCVPCTEHDLDELSTLRDHANRAIDLVATARDAARKAKAEQDRASEAEQSSRRQTAAALSSRNRYREALRLMREWHSAGGTNARCLCGVSQCNVAEDLDAAMDDARKNYPTEDPPWPLGD